MPRRKPVTSPASSTATRPQPPSSTSVASRQIRAHVSRKKPIRPFILYVDSSGLSPHLLKRLAEPKFEFLRQRFDVRQYDRNKHTNIQYAPCLVLANSGTQFYTYKLQKRFDQILRQEEEVLKDRQKRNQISREFMQRKAIGDRYKHIVRSAE